MHFFDTTFLDAQIDLAQQLTNAVLVGVVLGAIAFFLNDSVQVLSQIFKSESEPQPQPLPELQPEAEQPALTPIPADEWEETFVVAAPGWEPSTAKQAKSLEDILFEPEPKTDSEAVATEGASEPLSFDQLKNYSIRQLKKLASGRITSYSSDPKLTLAERLAGRVFPQDLQLIS